MKTKLKSLTTLDKVIYLFFGIAIVLFIASVVPILNSVAYRWDFVLAYIARFTPYMFLGVTAVFSNKYNVRRLVSLNLVYLAICFFATMVTDFNVMLFNVNQFLGINSVIYYTAIVFVTLLIAGICSHCSNSWIYFYGCLMFVLAVFRGVLACIDYNKFMVSAVLMMFSLMAYFFTLIAVTERFNEDNKYTNLCDKIFDDVSDEVDEKSQDNNYCVSETFKIMMAKSLADDNENLSDYYEFYECLKNSDFTAMQEKGFLTKDFITKFCKYVSDYLSENTYIDSDVVLSNITKILASEDTDEVTYKRELMNLYYLISKELVFDSSVCADKMDISYKSDNEVAKALSPVTDHPVEMDGVQITSMESFLQSLKYKNKKKQMKICKMSGKKARRKYKFNNLWKWNGGKLYWQGQSINRFEDEYQNLLVKCFATMACENDEFKNALMSTVDEDGIQKLFDYSDGKDNPQDAILTADEFIDRLYIMRRYLINDRENKND